MSKTQRYETFEHFIKHKCPEYAIEKGSQFEAKLWLAYDEMQDIFKKEEYKLNYKIGQLEKENKKLKEDYECFYY